MLHLSTALALFVVVVVIPTILVGGVWLYDHLWPVTWEEQE